MTDSPLDEIMLALQKETGEAWERYEGAEYDELDEYGDAYDNAFHKAKQAIEQYCHKQVIEELEKLYKGHTTDEAWIVYRVDIKDRIAVLRKEQDAITS